MKRCLSKTHIKPIPDRWSN